MPPTKSILRDQKLTRQRIAQNLQQLRQKLNWTQEEAAHSIGIHFRHLQKLEYAKVNCTVDTLTKVAKAYGIDIRDLF